MVHVINVRGVNEALPQGIEWLKRNGIEEQSRNGRVLVSPVPVVTVYNNPSERVLTAETRNANPFFHLMESLWMLAGRNDVEFPAYYAKQIAEYSDDGKTLHGAYGYRWRHAMRFDQLEMLIDELKRNPNSRRCVLQMWDSTCDTECSGYNIGMDDLGVAVSGGKDVCCNTQAYFDTLGGKLNMTVTCRSNDIIWGAYGANAVHFSMLLEYMAACTGLSMGVYRQFSNNYHAYIDRPDVQRLFEEDWSTKLTYINARSVPMLKNNVGAWHRDLELFFLMFRPDPTKPVPELAFSTEFWRHVVVPMVNAHHYYKMGRAEDGLSYLNGLDVASCDWTEAGKEWLIRRIKNVE